MLERGGGVTLAPCRARGLYLFFGPIQIRLSLVLVCIGSKNLVHNPHAPTPHLHDLNVLLT
jgi:hypothetical protein